MRIDIYHYLPSQAKQIRETVFLKEQGFEEEYDDMDECAVHFVAYEEKTAVGTCRVFWNDEVDSYVIGRLAVLKEYRGRKIGAYLVKEAEKYVKSKEATQLQLHAQCIAVNFYNRLGYSEYGEIEYEEHCPHIWMRKEIC